MLNRPGFHTSEFKVAVANALVQIVLAWQGYVGDPTAVKLSVGGFVAYIVSRGFAKTEPRP